MRKTSAFLLFISFLWTLYGNPALAQRYINNGPPFISLQSPEGPSLTPSGPAALLGPFGQERYEEAVGIARQTLAEARKNYDASDAGQVPALQDLATSQYYAEDYSGAIKTYKQAITILELNPDSRDPRLADPLFGLGVAQFAAGAYDEAADNLRRAVFVTRVNDGLNSLNQLRFYDALTESYLALGQYDEAVARQKVRIAVVQQATSPDSMEVSLSIEKAAQLYRRIGRFAEERELRRREVNRLSEMRGFDDLSLVSNLRELAATYRLGYSPQIIAVGDLERALSILDKHPETNTLQQRVAVLLELGDLFTTFDDTGRAKRYYNRAYALLAAVGDEAQIQALFSEPVPVFVPRPNPVEGVSDQPAARLPQGYVLLQYDLGATGKPRSIEALEIDPAQAKIMKPRAERALRSARFRPAIGPEGPVSSQGLHYRLDFNYAPSDR